MVGNIPVVGIGGAGVAAVLHPFWDKDMALAANRALELLYFETGSMAWTTTFNLSRRMGEEMLRLRSGDELA